MIKWSWTSFYIFKNQLIVSNIFTSFYILSLRWKYISIQKEYVLYDMWPVVDRSYRLACSCFHSSFLATYKDNNTLIKFPCRSSCKNLFFYAAILKSSRLHNISFCHTFFKWFIILSGYLSNMHHPEEDKVFIIHVSEMTPSHSIGKFNLST